MVITTEADLERWLAGGPNRERSNDYSDWKLDPIRRAVAALPTPPPRPVTIAGTKGKGSTLAFTEAVLRAHDRRTVAFTSPHLLSVCERWRIDGHLATVAEIALHIPTVEAALASAGHHGTYFERCFLVACCLAAARPTAVFLCEVGVGGRLDCANTLDAQLVCLTSLGLDHTAILGDTLSQIAGEKLGVCRADAPLLISAQSREGEAAIAERLPSAIAAQHIPPLGGSPSLGLPGDHQRANAAVALAAARQLLGDAYHHPAALDGLARAQLPGRCQLITRPGGQRILIDGAHTAESMAATVRTAHTLLRGNWAILFGIAADKAIARVAAQLPASGHPITRCGYAFERCAGEHHPAWPPSAQAWPWAADCRPWLATLPGDGLVSGSFYLAGEALAALHQEARIGDLPGAGGP